MVGLKGSLRAFLGERERGRRDLGLVRGRRVVEASGPGLRVRVDGRELVSFCSNDYLGLAAEPGVAQDANALAGGSGASPLVTGYSPAHRELEAALADFVGSESVVLFPSGYQANLAVGQALLTRGESVLADRLNHASLNDGVRLSGARLLRYRHADFEHAGSRFRSDTRLLATDGVFSMDGDIAPLNELCQWANRHDLPVWLDDAHGFGVLGETGRGTVEHLGLKMEDIDIFVATFGKALGTAGAFVAGDRTLIEHLVNVARGLIYSTASPPSLAAATLHTLKKCQQEHWRRDKLNENIARFQTHCARYDVGLNDSSTAIQILTLGDNVRAMSASTQLEQCGFLITAIRPPTVPEGTARLRITLSAAHLPQDIERLCRCLARVCHSTAKDRCD